MKKILPLVGIIILIILLIRADISKVILSLESANYQYLLLVLFFIIAGLVLNTLKWSILLKRQKLRVAFGQLLRFNLIGQFYGMVTPGRLGNLIRINYLKKHTQKSYSESSVSVFLDRIVDLLGILILSVLGIFIFLKYLPIRFIYLNIACLFLVLVIIFFIINQKLHKKWLRFIYSKLVPLKYKQSLKSVYYSFYQDSPKYFALFLVVLLSLLIWLILMTGSYFVVKSLNINISWLYLMPALAISTVISLLPVSISGWGTREMVLLALFAPFHIGLEQILAFSILNFFLLSVLPGLVGAGLAIFKK